MLASDFATARETLGLHDESARQIQQQEEHQQEEDNSEFALPEGDLDEASQAIAEERERSRSSLKDWYPEDAD